jgi:hypothetical protein
MKLDPGIHIVKDLVFFGKSGVTAPLSPCSLEGRTVLLELGMSRAHLRLPLRRQGSRPSQVLARLSQRLIPLQERRPHLRDSGSVFRSSGVQLQELVMHGLNPILQPPVVGLQGLDKGVVLVSVPVTLGAKLVEAVMPLPSSALQLLLPTDKVRGKLSQRKRKRGRGERGDSKIQQKKCVPRKPTTRDLRGSAAPRSACC